MTTTRSLFDLYVVGRIVELSDGEPERDEHGDIIRGDDGLPKMRPPVEVWIQRLAPLDHKRAVRAADAAKAKVLAASKDHEGELWTSAYEDVIGLGNNREVLIEFLASQRAAERQEAIAAEVEGDDDEYGEPSEWKKDNYLQGLFDAWENGLKLRYAEDPEDEEAKRIWGELKRFLDLVDERMEEEKALARAELADFDLDSLREKIAESYLESTANSAWFQEFSYSRVFLATRKPNKRHEYYLQSREDVERLDERVLSQLVRAIEAMAIGVTEGKGLPGTPASSQQSEPPAPAATSTSSGPAAVTA